MMTAHLIPKAALFAVGLIVFGGLELPAAKAPLDPEELKEQSAMIIAGEVLEVRSKAQRSKIASGVGIHRDRVFHIRVRVAAVVKGAKLEPGDEIEVVAWKPICRIPPQVGLQGHEQIPKVGDKATFYLKGKDGQAFKPILPNGIEIAKAKSKAK